MAEFGDGKKKALMGDEELQEEEIWAVRKERESSSMKLKIAGKDQYSSRSPASPSACRISGLPRVLPRVNSGSFDSRAVVLHHHHSSAPLNIPDWSKIYPSKKSDAWGAADDHDHDHQHDFADFAKRDDDDEDSEEMMPPHEIIARRLARSPVVSFSMCEGIGRTLKGRDLSRLRNAILTKTGFLE